jgi:hypothetical protein
MDAFFDNVLRWLTSYSTIVSILLGIGILIYIRKFIIGLREWQKSVFGLEKNLARRKLVTAFSGLILLLLLFVGEFLLVTVIGPQMPAQSSERVATINPVVTPTVTLIVDESQEMIPQITPTVFQESLESACVEDVLEITSPENGERVAGVVEITGTVNVPNFGYYKYEYSTIGTINWITIAAEDQLKLDEVLGYWNTTELTPGPYLLQIVPLDNVGETLPSCIISVEVVAEE